MNFYSGKQTEIDRALWRDVVSGDKSAFESVVDRHQASVVAVAFSICGDFAGSQDIAQETFWAAWNSRDKLLDAKRLGAWLRGISKNLARNWYRNRARKSTSAQIASGIKEPISRGVDPVDDMISEEERKIVWSSVDKLAENYRSVLKLYYDEGCSIEEVAAKLGITNATARQRLARGRDKLRSCVAQNIEGVIDRMNPGRSFTSRVMAGITGAGVAASAHSANAAATTSELAIASAAAVAAKTLSPGVFGVAGSVLGALGGMLGGLLGAFLGVMLPSELAPTETERQLLWHRGKPLIAAGIIFTFSVALICVAAVFGSFWPLAIGLPISIIGFQGFLFLNVIKTMHLVKKLRKEITPETDPNQSGLAKRYGWGASHDIHQSFLKGRSYESDWKLFGLPLISIQTSDVKNTYNEEKREWKVARGWIAAGDIAQGMIVGIGYIAIAPIAMGSVSIGILSFGLLALGGLAIAVGAFGFLSIGAIAMGYDAVGGLAIAWHSACGGGAYAYVMAYGGGAHAEFFAVGGAAHAIEANTEIANQMLEEHSYKWLMDYMSGPIPMLVIAPTLLGAMAFRHFCYEVSKLPSKSKGKATA